MLPSWPGKDSATWISLDGSAGNASARGGAGLKRQPLERTLSRVPEGEVSGFPRAQPRLPPFWLHVPRMASARGAERVELSFGRAAGPGRALLIQSRDQVQSPPGHVESRALDPSPAMVRIVNGEVVNSTQKKRQAGERDTAGCEVQGSPRPGRGLLLVLSLLLRALLQDDLEALGRWPGDWQDLFGVAKSHVKLVFCSPSATKLRRQQARGGQE